MPVTLAAEEIVGNADVDVADGILVGAGCVVDVGGAIEAASVSAVPPVNDSGSSLMLVHNFHKSLYNKTNCG